MPFRGATKMSENYLRLITRERGRQLITAGGPDQEAMETAELQHSVFSYYLLAGIAKVTFKLIGVPWNAAADRLLLMHKLGVTPDNPA